MLQSIEVQTGENPQASVIVLHGLGADGRDFVPVAQALDLRTIGDVRYILPHAPIRPVTLNNGYPMRAWYDIVALGGRAARRSSDRHARVQEIQADRRWRATTLPER